MLTSDALIEGLLKKFCTPFARYADNPVSRVVGYGRVGGAAVAVDGQLPGTQGDGL
jgi:hypothetical protein